MESLAREIGGRGAKKEARQQNLIRNLAGGADQRAAAYDELTALTLEDAPDLRVAAACVAPLIESVLCKDVSEVDAQEFRRASLVLAKLCWMDRQVRSENCFLLCVRT